jgi:hypothetical protein
MSLAAHSNIMEENDAIAILRPLIGQCHDGCRGIFEGGVEYRNRLYKVPDEIYCQLLSLCSVDFLTIPNGIPNAQVNPGLCGANV